MHVMQLIINTQTLSLKVACINVPINPIMIYIQTYTSFTSKK
jgi:hypothetical protein